MVLSFKLFGAVFEFRRETDEEVKQREDRDRETRQKNAETYRRFFGWRL